MQQHPNPSRRGSNLAAALSVTLLVLMGIATLVTAQVNPAAVTDLRIAHTGASALLTWTHTDASVGRYEVWRSDGLPYAAPGAADAVLIANPTPPALHATLSITDRESGIADPARNSFYTVRGVDAAGTPGPASSRAGEIDLPLVLGAGCPFFPGNNVWNTKVDTLPPDPGSSAYVNSIGAAKGLHADFGSGTWDGGPIGIPYTTVAGAQPKVAVSFDYADESDPGPYPIPTNALIEGGPDSSGDRHVLVLDNDHCLLYEMWDAWPRPDGSWAAGSGAVFDLRSHALRPAGWTSADAAGLPVLPGLVRYDEAASGQINHALRFTVPRTRRAYLWPARHYASSYTDPNLPPMGQRFRLKASFDTSGFSAINRAILQALKTYGLFLADNGSAWYLSGVPDERWDNDDLRQLQERVHGSDFEAVDESALMVAPDSGQAAAP